MLRILSESDDIAGGDYFVNIWNDFPRFRLIAIAQWMLENPRFADTDGQCSADNP